MFVDNLNPVAFTVANFKVNWYSLSYPGGALIFYFSSLLRIKYFKNKIFANIDELTIFTIYCFLGVLCGARLFYCIFYQFNELIHNPLFLFTPRKGGSSFHGGVLGAVILGIFYCKKYNKSFFALCDFVAPIIPITQFHGRIGNFINGELWGVYASPDLPWAMAFPRSGNMLPRHPSQLYEALGEGLLQFIILFAIAYYFRTKLKVGELFGYFLMSYGLIRIPLEHFRMPDNNLIWVKVFTGFSMGQWLCVATFITGCMITYLARQNKFTAISIDSK